MAPALWLEVEVVAACKAAELTEADVMMEDVDCEDEDSVEELGEEDVEM